MLKQDEYSSPWGEELARYALCLALAISLATVATPSAQAWSTGSPSADPGSPDCGTHGWIADMALANQVSNMTFLSVTYHTEFLLGTEAPDNESYGLDYQNHHVYYYETGQIQDDIGAQNAALMYDLAVDCIGTGNPSQSAFYFGAMTHYISDIGVFGHTMGTDTDWGVEFHHADYESYVDSLLDSLRPIQVASLGCKDPYNVTLDLAKNITFGMDTVMPNVWMDTHYDWTNATFKSSAIASLYASVEAVATAISYVINEVNLSAIPENSYSDKDSVSLTPQFFAVMIVVSVAVMVASAVVVSMWRTRKTR